MRGILLGFHVQNVFLRRCVEAQYIIKQTPHLWVEEARWLTEDGHEVVSSPFKFALVARHGKRHLGGEDALRQVWENVQEIDEIGVRAGIEDNLH